MELKLRVRRYDPEASGEPRYQSYTLDVPEYFTLLDALIQVREEQDGTLGLRCSCRSAICGSCVMRIDGHARLACKTKAISLATQGGEITVEPAGNMPVLKDLIVDMAPFWDKVRAVQPWLQPEGPPPEREYIVANEAMQDVAGAMNCIMCGACVSDCTVLEAELKLGRPMGETFLGPAALAKAYRFVGDPRDAHQRDRLRALSQPEGIWDCTHCFECVEVCPKGVAPMDRIMQLREKAAAAGFTNNHGTRHARAFADSVKKYGRLDEVMLVPKSLGMFNLPELLPQAPAALRMLRAGKLRLPHKADYKEKIERIFVRLEKKAGATPTPAAAGQGEGPASKGQ